MGHTDKTKHCHEHGVHHKHFDEHDCNNGIHVHIHIHKHCNHCGKVHEECHVHHNKHHTHHDVKTNTH
jgi:hypothetical protein